jgi:phosphatidylglycerophosphate synthase
VQTSAFGAFLDVAVDCVSRGALYAWAIEGPAGAFMMALEFLTFVATHKVTTHSSTAPLLSCT